MNKQIKSIKEVIKSLQKRIVELEEQDRLKLQQKRHAKKEKQARIIALALCKKFDIDCQVDEQDRIWAYIRISYIDKYFDGTDPWDDNHHFDSWQDLMSEIQKNFIPKVLGVYNG